MSVESEILRIRNKVAGSYLAVATKGGVIPVQQTLANLSEAINSIPSGCSLKVVAYTTFPEVADEYTIGIISNDPVSEYFLDSVQPSLIDDGYLWIKLASVGPYAVKLGDIANIYPIGAKRYVNDAWNDLDVRVFINGEWKLLTKNLYTRGIRDVEWVSNRSTFYNDYVFVQDRMPTSGTTTGVLCTSDLIDVTDWNYLCAEIAITRANSNCRFNLGLNSTSGTGTSFNSVSKQTSGASGTENRIIKVDISSVIGQMAVKITTSDNGSGGYYGGTNVYRVWLEG